MGDRDCADKITKEASWMWTQLCALDSLEPERRMVTFFSTSACYMRSRRRFLEIVCGMAAWLKSAGVDDGDYVAIDATLRFESLVTWCACMYLGAIAVFYPDDMRASAREADAAERKLRIVVAENPERAQSWLLASKKTCKKIKNIVYMDVRGNDGVMIDKLLGWPLPEELIGFEACVEQGVFKHKPAFETKTNETCVVTFSQGATNGERATELSHKLLKCEAEALSSVLKLGDTDTVFLATDCAYAYTLGIFAACLFSGADFAFGASGSQDLLARIEQIQPQYLFMLPRQVRALSHDIVSKSSKNVVHAKWNSLCVMAGKFRNRNSRSYLNWTKDVIDSVCLRHLKNRLGTRCRGIVSFGAGLHTHDAKFFSYLDIPVFNAYVVAEAGGFAHIHQFGGEGGFLPSCEAKIRHGKLSLRMIGNRDFVFTGDYVFEDEVTGLCVKRVERITLEKGQEVDTTALHEILTKNDLIDEALIFGENRPYLTALIYLNPEQLAKWATDQKISEARSFEKMCQHPKVYEFVKQLVKTCSATRSQAEEIRKIALLPVPIEDDPRVLTPSGLVRRYEVEQRYAGILSSFYTEEF